VRTSTTTILLSLTLFACGDDQRPPPAEETSFAPLASDPTASDPSASEPDAAEVPTDVCEAHSQRACQRTFVDALGITHCPKSIQFCSGDGTAWFPCGEYTKSAAGELVAPDTELL
jgi:hypothetical protein